MLYKTMKVAFSQCGSLWSLYNVHSDSDVSGRKVTEMFLGDTFDMGGNAQHRPARVPSS